MFAKVRITCWAVVASLLVPGLALAQFPSELVSFEDTPSGDPANQEMFQEPEASGSTDEFVVPNTTGTFDRNGAFRSTEPSFATDGAQSLEVYWDWVAEGDSNAWLRLTTFLAAVRPNPALDTGGKVRFDITNFGNFNGGDLGICLGIRETGVVVPQLADGGTTVVGTGTPAPIEWVGVDTTVNAIIAGSNGVAETTASGDDVQAILVGSNGLSNQAVVILPGVNGSIDTVPAGDDVARFGYFIGTNGTRTPIPAVTLVVSPLPYSLEFDLATGNVTVDDGFGPVVVAAGIAGMTGNGVLDAPNSRGTLEHIALTNVTTDPATGTDVDVRFGIDALQFEATTPDPAVPPTVVAPVFEGATSVQVQGTPGATQTELFVNDVSVGTATPNANGLATHTGLAALVAGDALTAKQTKDAQTSDLSAPVIVFAVGVIMADNFDSYSTQADLNVFWEDSFATPTPPDAKVRLQAGGAASCPNFLREDNPSGANASRLYRSIGSVNGTDADPLWVTWNFRYVGADSGSGIRTRFELANFDGGPFSAGNRGEGSCGITINNTVAGALFTDFNLTLRVTANTTLLADLTSNGWTNAKSFLRAPSGVAHADDGWHKMQIEVRDTTLNYYIDGVNVNPVGFELGVPRPNATPFTHVIIGEGFSNNGPMIMFDNVSVTTGAGGTKHPFGDPAELAPTVLGPLFPAQTTVTVTDIDTTGSTTEVRVFADGGEIVNVTTAGFESPTLVVTVPALVNGQEISASQIIAGSESCASIPVEVGVPAPTLDDPFLVPGQTLVTIGGLQAGLATAATVYANDTTVLANVTTTAFANATTTVTVSPALVNGDSITATQTVGGIEGFASTPQVVAVPAPTVDPAATIGDGSVTVLDLHPLATDVTVYVNDVLAGTAPTGGAASAAVTLGVSLAAGDVVEATQTIGGFEGPRSAAVSIAAAFCNVVYYSDLDSAAGWTVNITSDGSATFGFDYSTMGIPPSPHGGGSTLGVRFTANESAGVASQVVATPNGVSMSGSYQVRFDFWINANGPFPGGGYGSTEFLGGGVGYDGVTAGLNGASMIITGEGGASRDWRMYKNTGEQFIASGQYTVSSNNAGGAEISAAFPGLPAPALQQANFPQQTGTMQNGSGGFAWHTMVITVDSTLGRANFVVDGLSIGTLDSNIGSPVATSGPVDLIYADLFSSVSDNALLSFGVVDNFAVLTALPAGGANGDWDNNGVVNLVDYERFADCLAGPTGTPNPVSGAGCTNTCRDVFDADVDGDIDLFDFAAFARSLQ